MRQLGTQRFNDFRAIVIRSLIVLLLVERIDAFNPFRPYDLNEAIPNP